MSFPILKKYTLSLYQSQKILLIDSMSSKMEYADNISNDTLPMFEPHPDIYIHLKLEEIINSHLVIIPLIKLIVLGQVGVSMMHENMHSLNQKTWQDPTNPGAFPSDIGNLTLQMKRINIIRTYGKVINIDHLLCTALDKVIPDHFKPVQQIRNCDLKTAQFVNLWMNYFTHMVTPQ